MASSHYLTDEELVVVLREDNEEALRMLYDKYWKQMLAWRL